MFFHLVSISFSQIGILVLTDYLLEQVVTMALEKGYNLERLKLEQVRLKYFQIGSLYLVNLMSMQLQLIVELYDQLFQYSIECSCFANFRAGTDLHFYRTAVLCLFESFVYHLKLPDPESLITGMLSIVENLLDASNDCLKATSVWSHCAYTQLCICRVLQDPQCQPV